jgi:hypothetical protein
VHWTPMQKPWWRHRHQSHQSQPWSDFVPLPSTMQAGSQVAQQALVKGLWKEHKTKSWKKGCSRSAKGKYDFLNCRQPFEKATEVNRFASAWKQKSLKPMTALS